jgi:flagellar biosynthetic protein FliO
VLERNNEKFTLLATKLVAIVGDNYNFTYKGPEDPTKVNLPQVFWRMLVSLAVVLVLFFFLSRLLRKYLGRETVTKHLEVTDRLPLGINKELFIVRVGKQFLLLGVTNNNVNLLKEIKDQETVNDFEESAKDKSIFEEILAAQDWGKGLTLSALEAKLTGLGKVENEEPDEGPKG